MAKSVFEYREYKLYLHEILDSGASPRGARTRLAQAAKCHTAYVSQVLNGHAHFSLEQAEMISRFLELSKNENAYFLALVQHNRAGTTALRAHFDEQLKALLDQQFILKNRLEFKRTLTREDQMTFYSSWHYGAVHVLVSVPGCSTPRGIAEYLGVPVEKVKDILRFLEGVGLVVSEADGTYRVGTTHIHLESDSPMISRHHSNWRMKAVQSLDQTDAESLHYSSVITASEADSVRIKSILVKAIEDVRAVVKPSKDEAGFCYCIDFFGLKKS